MDELVKVVVKKTGLPEAQAKAAVTAVLDYLKKKLPAPVAGQVEALVQGGQAASMAEGLLKGVEGALKKPRAGKK